MHPAIPVAVGAATAHALKGPQYQIVRGPDGRLYKQQVSGYSVQGITDTLAKIPKPVLIGAVALAGYFAYTKFAKPSFGGGFPY